VTAIGAGCWPSVMVTERSECSEQIIEKETLITTSAVMARNQWIISYLQRN